MTVGSFGYKGNEFAPDNRFAFATDYFDATYVSVTATADELVISAYNVDNDGAVTLLDTVTVAEYVCEDGEHAYRVNLDAAQMICDHCDHRVAFVEYVGPAFVNNDLYFFDQGTLRNGWVEHDGKTYYFMPWAADGETTIGGYTYIFEDYTLKIGAWFERDGITMLKWAGVTQRNTWITMDGKTYYFRDNGAYMTGVVEVPIENDGITVYEYHSFDENGVHQGRLEDGLHVYDDLIIYTENGVAKHMGLVMDEEGNFYYINSSGIGVRNVTRSITGKWTNGLLPEGTYTFGADGKMIDPPTVTE
jgi:hypothetical protein